MDRMTSLRVFREVVESGSFAAAADRLSLSAPMASKHVSELEQSLGARLLHCSSRHSIRPALRSAARAVHAAVSDTRLAAQADGAAQPGGVSGTEVAVLLPEAPGTGEDGSRAPGPTGAYRTLRPCATRGCTSGRPCRASASRALARRS